MTRPPSATEAETVAAQDYVRRHLLDGPDVEEQPFDNWMTAYDERQFFNYSPEWREDGPR